MAKVKKGQAHSQRAKEGEFTQTGLQNKLAWISKVFTQIKSIYAKKVPEIANH